ncbi:phenylalanine--tRNA ligase subunit alpha [Candidatus Uhrbacteria bacterium]|nr:phenylalanine--tRNA ligase subunit alpha [Candidatus Uhrbacteria bacterium]
MEDLFISMTEEGKKLFAQANSAEALEHARVAVLGRKGMLTQAMDKLNVTSPEERKAFGQAANTAKTELARAFEEAASRLGKAEKASLGKEEWIDVTLPGTAPRAGHLHIVSQTIAEVEKIFARIGFTRYPVPEVDWDYYAFEALNMPPDHPARDNWETYFLDVPEGPKGKLLATPHPSNNQVRLMETLKPPFRALYIGKAYRRQSDVSHVPIHHQFETEVIDKQATFTELKGVIEFFVYEYFGRNRKIRLRPHHFRFTEPSFEIDINCAVCGGSGCRLCKQGWLELAGAGMTHPNVLRAGGLDPKIYRGFAFAFGVERVLMMRDGIRLPDMRELYKNDLRFLKQF